MDRRSFLATSAAALSVGAGCLSNSGRSSTRSDTPHGSEPATEPSSQSQTPPLSGTNDDYGGGFTTGRAWGVQGFDPTRRGFNPATSVPDADVGAAWVRTPVEGRRTFRTTAPVTDDSQVYVGSGTGKDPEDDQRAGFVAAFDGETGDRAWRTTVTDGSIAGVSYADDHVLAVSRTYEPPHATLTALAPADGGKRWQVEIPPGPDGGPIVVGGRAFVVGESDGLTAVSLEGTHQWTRPVGDGDHYASTGPCATESTLYVGTDRGRVAAISTDDGEIQWTSAVVAGGHRPRIQTIPTVADGTVYVTGTDYILYAVDAADGTVRWETRLLEQNYGNSLPSVVVVDDTVYANTIHGGLIAYDRTDGTERWRTGKYGGSLAPAGADDVLVAPTSGGSVAGFDRSGDRRWTFEMPAFDAPGMAAYIMNPRIALAHNRVYVSLHDGRVFSLGTSQ